MFRVHGGDTLALIFYSLFWFCVLSIAGWNLSQVWHLIAFNWLAVILLSLWMSYITVVIYKSGER
ncbi:MAG: hypothetical protein KGH79_02885 [Patescibacteria group bacterium]|nr:hypothetical protein [Patescibacteria group bacterium]